MDRRTWRVLIRRAAPFVVAGAVFLLLGRNLYQNWDRLGQYEWNINYLYLGLSFALIGATFALIVFGWLLILRRLDVRLPFWKGFRVWFLSALGKYIPGKVWQAFAMVYLSRKEGITVEKSATSAILVQILSIVPGVSLFIVTVKWVKLGLRGWSYPLLLFIPLGLFVTYPPVLEALVNFLARKLKREGIHFRATYATVLGLMLLYLLTWFLYGCAFFSFVRAVAFVEAKHIMVFGGMFAGAYLLGVFSIFVPGGLGVREGALAFLLTPFFPLPVATAISLASRIWLTLAEAVCVGISLRGLRASASSTEKRVGQGKRAWSGLGG